ncbi:hypothetical protein M3B20_01430 [Corynebacterium sanguinis]|uniref:hypothetical protein n=1 Tax=Corynebacterium sanguinis TaxID=2594913 RepID=UPI0021A5C4F6|nr:hypothetical protein [Corynebacterium sanguinis]MCT1804397.1 hypothetical protein [Corynebacterium sanguinis]
MTTHPSLQPVLRRSNVATLIQFLRNERDDVMAQPGTADHSENAAYVRGLQYAIDTITTMWASAVIASDALEQTIREDLVEDEIETSETAKAVDYLTDAVDYLEFALTERELHYTQRYQVSQARNALVDVLHELSPVDTSDPAYWEES